MAAAVSALGLNPSAGDLDAQLHQRIDAGENLVKSQGPVDFVGASRNWANRLGKPEIWPALLDRRLSAAAQAEAVRPDADLIRARDLQLAAKAAERLSSNDGLAAATTQPSGDPRTAFSPAMEAMKREHELYARPNDVRPPNQIAEIRTNAAKGRELMRRWAGDEAMENAGVNTAATTAPADLVMAANEAAARHQYDRAKELDQARTHAAVDEKEAVNRSMTNAEGIDQLHADQEKLRAETETAHEDQAKALAAKQAEIEKKIEGAEAEKKEAHDADDENPDAARKDEEDPDYRDEEGAALSKAQEQLAAMPEQLTGAEHQFGDTQRSKEKAAAADRAAQAASGDGKAAAQRAAAAAKGEADEVRQQIG